MNFLINLNSENTLPLGFAGSLLLHLIIFLAAAFLFEKVIQPSSVVSPYVQISTNYIQEGGEAKITSGETEDRIKEEPLKSNEASVQPENVNLNRPIFIEADADTTGLQNIYSESTLNVSIKYPAGWTYLDQNVKNKLDGVTFWAAGSSISPPPYVHLEVREKFLFNPNRYSHNIKFRRATVYYNDPEELEGQVSQIFYFRTESNEDFTLKLIVKGRDNFNSFLPVFLGMLKTFKFRETIF